METSAVPMALKQRLGPEATAGLLDVFEGVRGDWQDDVIAISTDRFERRLTDEVGQVRVAIVREIGTLRHEMAQGEARVQHELAGLRQDVATSRFEVLKWSFIFWIGQVLALAGVLNVLLRRG